MERSKQSKNCQQGEEQLDSPLDDAAGVCPESLETTARHVTEEGSLEVGQSERTTVKKGLR